MCKQELDSALCTFHVTSLAKLFRCTLHIVILEHLFQIYYSITLTFNHNIYWQTISAQNSFSKNSKCKLLRTLSDVWQLFAALSVETCNFYLHYNTEQKWWRDIYFTFNVSGKKHNTKRKPPKARKNFITEQTGKNTDCLYSLITFRQNYLSGNPTVREEKHERYTNIFKTTFLTKKCWYTVLTAYCSLNIQGYVNTLNHANYCIEVTCTTSSHDDEYSAILGVLFSKFVSVRHVTTSIYIFKVYLNCRSLVYSGKLLFILL